MQNKNIILEKSFEFALEVVAYCEELEVSRKYIIAKQLLRSGTSIGANIRESQSCESRADFIHKLKLSAKEASETEYWLLLCQHSKNYPKNELLVTKLNDIQRLLSSIISSAKKAL